MCIYLYGWYAWVLICFSRVWLCTALWIVACQAPLSMGFSRQDYWSRLPCPPPGDLSDPSDWHWIFYVSCISRQLLYHQCHLGSPIWMACSINIASYFSHSTLILRSINNGLYVFCTVFIEILEVSVFVQLTIANFVERNEFWCSEIH